MKLEIEVPEHKISEMVKTRIDELFSTDARYRETRVRDLVMAIVDEAAVSAVRSARNEISAKLPEMARESVARMLAIEIDNAAKRGLSALRKLYAGFDPSKLTDDQRAWLVKQIAEAGKK